MKSIIEKIKELDIPIQWVFIIVAFVEAMAFSIIVPMNQVPDEYNHYHLITKEIGAECYAEDIYQYFNDTKVLDMVGDASSKVDKEHYFDKTTKFSCKLSESGFKPNKNIIRHLPSTIGLLIGIVLNLPIFYCLFLAELFSVIFYVFLGYLTLKVMPIKKEMMFLVLLMPMTLQQCSSVNYDNVNTCVSLFLIAFVFYLIYEKEKVIIKDVVLVLLCSLVILITKPPYIFIALLLFAVPLDKFCFKIGKYSKDGLKKRDIVILLSVLVLLFIGGLYIGRHNNFVKIFIAACMDPITTIKIIINTFTQMYDFYLRSFVGNFGGFDSSVGVFYIVLFFIFMTYVNIYNISDHTIRIKDRVFSLIIGLVSVLLIFISMLEWTYRMNGWQVESTIEGFIDYNKYVSYIQGVQGRYFIPIVPLLLIPFSGDIKNKSTKYKIISATFYIYTFIYIMNILKLRYWG